MVLVPFFDETEPDPPNNVECPCWKCWRRSLQRAKCNKPQDPTWRKFLWLSLLRGPANGHRAMGANGMMLNGQPGG